MFPNNIRDINGKSHILSDSGSTLYMCMKKENLFALAAYRQIVFIARNEHLYVFALW